MSNDTTKVRSVPAQVLDEMRSAQNAFAVAVKDFTANPTKENRAMMDAAQENLYQVQDLYRQGRKLRLAHAIDQRAKAGRS